MGWSAASLRDNDMGLTPCRFRLSSVVSSPPKAVGIILVVTASSGVTAAPETIIGGSCYKYHFCREKTRLLSGQNTSFVATKLLSQQAYFCRDKHLSGQTYFVATKVLPRRLLLSRQTRVCRDKTRLLSQQKCCRDKHVFWPCDKNILSRPT